MSENKKDLIEAVEELLEMIEEKNICDEQNITWITDEDCEIESNKSVEFSELIEAVKEEIEKTK